MSEDTRREPTDDNQPENQNSNVETDVGYWEDEPSSRLSPQAYRLYRILYNEVDVSEEDLSLDDRLRIEAFEHQSPSNYVRRDRRDDFFSVEYDSELERHLKDPINLRLYTDGANLWDHFDKLEFFRILNAQIRFIHQQAGKPITVQNRLRELPLNDSQKYYLLTALNSRFTESVVKDKWLTPALWIIRHELRIYDFRVYREERIEEFNRFHREDIGALRTHLETLVSIREKLTYLIELRSDYLSAPHRVISNTAGDEADHPFVRQIDLEIEKLKQIQELARELPEEKSVEGQISKRGGKGDVGLRAKVRALHYLLEYLGVKNQTARADFIALVTGCSQGSVKNEMYASAERASRNGLEWERDLETARRLYERLGLGEVVALIERDLEAGLEADE